MKRLASLYVLLWTFLAGIAQAQPQPADGLRSCGAGITRDAERACDRQAAEQIANGSRITPLAGGWQLVRTRSPLGGADAVSVMHAADSARSDVNLVGLNVRCGRSGPEVLLITLNRTPKDDQPIVTVSTETDQSKFTASVIHPSEALLLPQASNALAREWQSATELSVDVRARSATIRGIIRIAGLADAMKYLVANCSER